MKWKAVVELKVDIDAKTHAEAQLILEDANFKVVPTGGSWPYELTVQIIDWEIKPDE